MYPAYTRLNRLADMPKKSCISSFKFFISIPVLICLQIVFPDRVLMKICITSRPVSLVARFVFFAWVLLLIGSPKQEGELACQGQFSGVHLKFLEDL